MRKTRTNEGRGNKHPTSGKLICYDCHVSIADIRSTIEEAHPEPAPVKKPAEVVPYWLKDE